MSALCPRCHTELPPDIGLVLCPNCGHPSVVDADGNLQEKNTPPAVEPEEAPPAFQMPNDDSSEAEVFQLSQPAIASLDFDSPNNLPPTPSEFSLFGDQAAEASQNDPFANMQQGSEELNISEYANSEFSQGKNGAFVYNVSISDIDSKEIREYLREAINDTRFNWDVQAIISQIKKGELLLKNLSPVKASILINRIKRLPVKIRWEQYAITQAQQDISNP